MIKISVIGSAGRNGLMCNINNHKYKKMIDIVYYYINQIMLKHNLTKDDIILYSGGAALSDHVAVSLFLENKISNLHLYFPCNFINSMFYNNKVSKQANRYHHLFSDQIGINSLDEINKAIDNGATYTISNGFFERNKLISNTDYLIALSFNGDNQIKVFDVFNDKDINGNSIILSGGTKFTWNHSKGSKKIHIPINLL